MTIKVLYVIIVIQIILIIPKEYTMAFSKGPQNKYAWTVTVGEKGQIVIPKQARELFGINPGDTLMLLGDTDKGIAIPPKTAFTELASAIFGTDKPEDDE